VHLACFADDPVDTGALDVLRGYCHRVAVVRLDWRRWLRAAGSFARGRSVSEGAFRSPEMMKVLRTWATQTRFAASIASASSVAHYLHLPELRGACAVVDFVDVDSQKWFDYAAADPWPRSWLYRSEAQRVRQLERNAAEQSSACTLVSDAEAELCRQHCPGDAIHVVPNGVDLDSFRPTPSADEQSCAFVGALDYRPNVDAAVWFCDRVWPQVRKRYSSATLYIVGRRPVRCVRNLSHLSGVVVAADVPDVRPYLARAAAAVTPLRIARGIQNKVLEAMAMGKAVVASPQSLTGLDVEPDTHVLCASTEAEWVEAVGRAFDDGRLRRRLGFEARRYVEEHHHWDRCLEPLDSLLGIGAADLQGVCCES
jgi:sugar transferase (PEP-CTERM/EpsH1 system associated)